MLSKVYDIRRLSMRLEDDIKECNYLELMENCLKVEQSVEEIRKRFKSENPHMVRRHEAASDSNFKYQEINEIEFLYKPLATRNVFEGNYIENFGIERTDQLKAAAAYKDHNDFWMNHETVFGTVYGSVPTELVGPSSAAILQKLGWMETRVKILDFGFDRDRLEIIEFCKVAFENFIIVVESQTKSYLVLQYLIDEKKK